MISTKIFGIITLKKLYFGDVEVLYCCTLWCTSHVWCDVHMCAVMCTVLGENPPEH